MNNPDLESGRRQCLAPTLVLGFVLFMTGCGGGGGSSDTTDDSSADTGTTNNNNTTTPTVDPEAARGARPVDFRGYQSVKSGGPGL